MNATADALRHRVLDSPLGPLVIAGTGDHLHWLGLPKANQAAVAPRQWISDAGWGTEIAEQLRAYFAGALRSFELPLAPRGTEFQQRVWRALVLIPYGETRSYGAIAAAIGEPRAVRAVGRANATNPIPIVVPCHRVIGSNGSLTGYGGGLEAKRWLLAFEKRARFAPPTR